MPRHNWDFPRCDALVQVIPGESPRVLRACRPTARSRDDAVPAEVPGVGWKCALASEHSGSRPPTRLPTRLSSGTRRPSTAVPSSETRVREDLLCQGRATSERGRGGAGPAPRPPGGCTVTELGSCSHRGRGGVSSHRAACLFVALCRNVQNRSWQRCRRCRGCLGSDVSVSRVVPPPHTHAGLY